MVQALLLDAAANLVRAEGSLIYSTCSIEDDEGSAQITSFLQRHADFRAVPAQKYLLAKGYGQSKRLPSNFPAKTWY